MPFVEVIYYSFIILNILYLFLDTGLRLERLNNSDLPELGRYELGSRANHNNDDSEQTDLRMFHSVTERLRPVVFI